MKRKCLLKSNIKKFVEEKSWKLTEFISSINVPCKEMFLLLCFTDHGFHARFSVWQLTSSGRLMAQLKLNLWTQPSPDQASRPQMDPDP